MKRIFKIASVLAAIAALVSCADKEYPLTGNTEVPGGKSDTVVPIEIVASFGSTKVSYADGGTSLWPSWEVGDEIIALGEGGANYSFTVKSVGEDKSAVISGEAPVNCQLHLIYCPGISASSLTVDYTAQTGAQNTMPAVMFSDGEIVNRKGEFTFRNAGGIICISAVNGAPNGSHVTKITVSGSNLSAATIALSGSALAITATEKADDAISVEGLDLTVTNDYPIYKLSAPVFLAVPAGAKIEKVSAFVSKEPETMTIPSTAADKKDKDYVEIEAKYDGTNLSTKKWAKWNVGANSETDYGWYFPWAGTEGYKIITYAGWQSVFTTSFELTYTPSSAYEVIASDYVSVKTQIFKALSYSFEFANNPYHNTGDNSDTGWTKYIPTSWSSYWSGEGSPDNKLVLDPEDDAARVNWGSTWRIPTAAEFKAMKNATYWACYGGGTNQRGILVFSPDASHTAGTVAGSVPGDLSKDSALLCIPTGGYGKGPQIMSVVTDGYYWSSTLVSSNPLRAYQIHLQGMSFSASYDAFRFYGCQVRPISD